MAKQDGIINIQGTLGNFTFVKSQDGYIVKTKSGVSAQRIKNDPSFQRTRENGEEFGAAGRAGRILRLAIKNLLAFASDSKMVSRLTKAMIAVLQADATSVRGKRNVLDGELEMLEGFDFNLSAKLSTVFGANVAATINRATGVVTVTVPAFVPLKTMNFPTGASHYEFVVGGSEIDFETEDNTSLFAESGPKVIDNVATASLVLSVTLPAASTKPLFLIFGVRFVQVMNGQSYALQANNCLQIVRVDGV